MIGNSSRLPSPGEVIEYAFLWLQEASAGLEEGRKSRPCLVLAVEERSGVNRVAVVPITTASHAPEDGVEVPAPTGARLGLPRMPCWIVFGEVNEFAWPGPDLRAAFGSRRQPFWRFGAVPDRLHAFIRDKVLSRYRAGSASIVRRTE
jgi:hypothetical protein